MPMMELPMTRIKESLPRMTFYKGSNKNAHKTGMPEKTFEKVNSKNNIKIKDRKRSMSASSNNSGRSFRATRKRPTILDGLTDE